ncbi:MAG: zinc-binding alcohol dehydrogenase family protein [Candidatus Promineifilaceae bacterium]
MIAESVPTKEIKTDMVTTEAWVIHAGSQNNASAQLRHELFSFPDITDDEVLAETICGCWEGNMTHAIERKPVDICVQRNEARVVLGNAGVVRILRTGSNVSTVEEGDICIIFCNGIWDEHGYPIKIMGYDAPNTMGVLAKQLKLHQKQVIPIPKSSPYSWEQWAAFSLRYVTAWANWRVAQKCWSAQMDHVVDFENAFVAAWGGGVSFAQCTLANHFGYQTIMVASSPKRLQMGHDAGIMMIDRRDFTELNYNEHKYKSDPAYRKRFKSAEKRFLRHILDLTNGQGISIFIDNIGTPVYPTTLKSLARQGVVTTCGWKHGMKIYNIRALECINRHTHVHTHYARYEEGVDAVHFANKHGWMPPVTDTVYEWNDIPQLATDYATGRINSYFPIFRNTDSLV